MPANNSGALISQLGRLWPARLGMLLGPGGWRKPSPYIPYALDNGAYPAFVNKQEWSEAAWMDLLVTANALGRLPAWAVVPDVVADKYATIERWHRYAPAVRSFGFPTAFAVQDGMLREHVPTDPAPDVIFVGGTTEWKWETLPAWCAWFPRVHVGRVNSLRRLLECEERGAESCDGSGWLRGDPVQTRELVQWVADVHPKQMRLFYFQSDEVAA